MIKSKVLKDIESKEGVEIETKSTGRDKDWEKGL
jgi:hypothetical protein